MFIPLHDDNKLVSINFQFVTVGLIIINAIVLLLTSTTVTDPQAMNFAMIPSELLQVGFWGGAAIGPLNSLEIPEQYTMISYMFLHGDIFHLLGNMIFLWVFGDNVEDAMGHGKFLIFYIACGVFAGLLYTWIVPESLVPLVGASGAVAGVIAAYLLLHPKVNVWVLVMKFFPMQIPATIILGFWVLTQVAMLFVSDDGNVAWWAHVGGLIAGAVLVIFMRRKGVPLLDGYLRT